MATSPDIVNLKDINVASVTMSRLMLINYLIESEFSGEYSGDKSRMFNG